MHPPPSEIAISPTRRAANRCPSISLRWAALGLILDAAAFLHGSIIISLVVATSYRWDYWDARMRGSNIGFTIRGLGDASVPIVTFLFLMWTIAITTAAVACVHVLRSPQVVGAARNGRIRSMLA